MSKRIVEVNYEQNEVSRQPKQELSIRREWTFKIMALILVMFIFFGIFGRVKLAAPAITTEDVEQFTGITCRIEDRFGQPIYQEGEVANYGLYGNLIGRKSAIHNSLLYKNADLLEQGRVNPIIGYRTLEAQPRLMKTTLLSEESQKVLAEMFGSKSGCCFAFNYETGEVYTALSLPAYNPKLEEPSYINRCLSTRYIPGSTMKVITATLAVDQKKDIEKRKYTCKQEYQLPDGNKVVCTGYHGTIDFATAIGCSCNCYFAQLIQDLNLEDSLEMLEKMKFHVNDDSVTEEMDRLSKVTSSVQMTNTASFKNVWGLIGQGDTEVSVIDMAKIAAAVVNGGKITTPYIVESITNPNNERKSIVYAAEPTEETLISKKTAKKTAALWREGISKYYYTNKKMNPRITHAKTGTAQQGDGNVDNLLIGVIESSKTAFYIVVEDNTRPNLPVEIANKLTDLLPNR